MRLSILILTMLMAFGCQQKDDSIQSSKTEKPPADKQSPAVTEQTGKFVINPQFGFASSFSEGLAAIHIGDDKTGKWGYIDKQGKIVINPQFYYADSFSEDLAAMRIGDEKTGKWGYISR